MGKCPLSGKPCDNQKTIKLKQINDGVIVQLDLCEGCGIDYVKTVQAPEPVGVLLVLNKSLPATNALGPCSGCGTTYEDLRTVGRFGCPACYQHFTPILDRVLAATQHGAGPHVGKTPSNPEPQSELVPSPEAEEMAIPAIEAKMAKAVKEERYEDAAVLRDILKKLKDIKA